MKSILLAIWIGALLNLPGCTSHSSGDTSRTVPESTFVKYYADWLVLQEEMKAEKIDSLSRRQKVDSLVDAYKITGEQVRKTEESYRGDLEAWRNFFDKVTKRLEKMQRDAAMRPNI